MAWVAVSLASGLNALSSTPRAFGDTDGAAVSTPDSTATASDTTATETTAPDSTSGSGEGGAASLPPPSRRFGHFETGRTIFENTCQPCHGPNAEGNRDLGAPALHSQEPWYLLAQLRKFRAGARGTDERDIGGQMMAPMAMALQDDQAMLDVATYITSLSAGPPEPTLRGDRRAGEKTFNTICASCHGPRGAGRPEIRTPALVGQADWYIATQLRNFRRGVRGFHELDVSGMQMRGMASALASDKAVVDVATYVASLSP